MDNDSSDCDNAPMAKIKQLEALTRVHASLLASAERRLLTWICGKLPKWVTPDRLTALGVASALLIGVAYALTSFSSAWLWAAVLGYFLNWFGDSLDGSLARHRKIERPAFGYFIDHSCDALATLLIMGGLGLSPYVRADIALFAATGYLLLAVHTFLAAKVTGTFKLSQGPFGPTELRLALIVLTIAMFYFGPNLRSAGGFSPFDLIVGSAAAACVLVFIVQTLRLGNWLLKEKEAVKRN